MAACCALLLAGCNSLTSSEVAALGAVISTAGAVAGVYNSTRGRSMSGASGAPGYYSPARPSGGYSQRQSFDDCYRVYTAAGRHDLARICQQRASNMSSLH